MKPLEDFEIHAPQIGDGRIESTYLIMIHVPCAQSLGEWDMLDLQTATQTAIDHQCLAAAKIDPRVG
jgi:hypothetical protein